MTRSSQYSPEKSKRITYYHGKAFQSSCSFRVEVKLLVLSLMFTLKTHNRSDVRNQTANLTNNLCVQFYSVQSIKLLFKKPFNDEQTLLGRTILNIFIITTRTFRNILFLEKKIVPICQGISKKKKPFFRNQRVMFQ